MAIRLKIIVFPGYVFISIFKSKVMLCFQTKVHISNFDSRGPVGEKFKFLSPLD